jgi:hypothetical protein
MLELEFENNPWLRVGQKGRSKVLAEFLLALAPSVAARPAAVRSSIQRQDPIMAPEDTPLAEDIWQLAPPVRVQGETLKTWNIGAAATERVQISLKSQGRPIDTNIELWHTPSYIPHKFRVYSEDGNLRPIHAVIESPQHPKTVAVYNTGPMEQAFDASVTNTGKDTAYSSLASVRPDSVQGGRITSYSFGPEVESVQVLLKTDTRNMKVKIELTQGPNQVKQMIEVYSSFGIKNPFYTVIQTPGANNAIRVINQETLEFPIDVWVIPYETGGSSMEPVIGGAGSW